MLDVSKIEQSLNKNNNETTNGSPKVVDIEDVD
jgi:hypothetical protein